ncbi:tetratricopeptide repeat protein [Pelagicoccus sp. SDUM812002]|uniref:tetratricopeptide repeat protein n=1 Tax=Pelagicoccus sp. SDUM812002 TaxID=3041266 RepID=UPI00280FC338|nr:tetratricopeptide repeat protein [Pelagicoccus sp. SDUM812002]MDQ8185636.1 tetratricopeptide repeat protein [Pelagicoccus sp. SDUM812002]
MNTAISRQRSLLRAGILSSLFVFVLSFASNLRAESKITWSSETGYVSEEVDLSGLLPEEQQKILNWMNRARTAEEKKNYSRAVKLYKRVSKKYPKNQYSPEALYRTALIQLERNNVDKAFEAFNTIAWVYPNYGSFNETLGEMYKIAVARLETYRDKIFWVIPGFKNTDRAIQYFERIVAIAPYSDYAPLSLMNVAKAWSDKNSDAMTIYALDRLVTNYPNSFLTSDAYLKLAQTHYGLIKGPEYDQRATEDAITFFEDFLIQYPENQNVDQAEDGLSGAKNILSLSKLKMGDFYYYKRSKYDAAKILYNEAITIAPLSKTAQTAKTRLEKIDAIVAKNEETVEEDAPSNEEIQEQARKRAKRRILGIF